MRGWIVTPVRFIQGQGWLTDLPDLHPRTRFGVWRATVWLGRLGLRAQASRDYTPEWDAVTHLTSGQECLTG